MREIHPLTGPISAALARWQKNEPQMMRIPGRKSVRRLVQKGPHRDKPGASLASLDILTNVSKHMMSIWFPKRAVQWQ
ncbi:hypothetical protein J2Y48_002379 [Mycoplana sp. BE70]|nr:hypothetical protein [Mycoplana sp. BE70]